MDRPEERVALVEVIERDGRPGRTVAVTAWPLALGRAIDNHVVLDDPHVAAQHLVVARNEDGQLTLTALPSHNGVVANGRRLPPGQPWPLPVAGATLVVGATRLRLRLPGEVLAPELPLPPAMGRRVAAPLAMGGALALLMAVAHWVNLDPGADYSTWLPLLIGVPVALAAWCAAWALMSKLFQHRFDFFGHLRIALPWLLAMTLAEQLLPQLAAALGQRWLWQLAQPLQGLLGALLVREHLAHLLPQHQRMVSAGMAAVVVAGGALSLALTYRSSDSFSSQPYMSTLPMPALRLAGTVPAATLVQDLAPLADKLAQRVKKAKADEDDDSADASD